MRAALFENSIDPRQLQLELTESTLMKNPEFSAELLKQISDIGIAVSIDDFGTGYSSLSYLKRFPISELKIDQSFIKDITTSVDDAAIAGAVVAMAHSLRLRVVAEGVETAEQMEFLRSLGCDLVQGYFISEPQSAREFERRLIAANKQEVTKVFGRVA